MVIKELRDLAQHNTTVIKSENFSKFALAHPYDRMAAAVVDLIIILLPLVLFVVAPFKHQMLESLLVQNEKIFALSIIFIALATLVIVMLYFTWFTHRLGATFGKILFGLKVVEIWGQAKPTWHQSLQRSMWLTIELFLFGLPWLGIFSNNKRRTWHDKFSDTCVIATHKRVAGAPSQIEIGIVRGFLTAFVFFFALTTVFEAYRHISEDTGDESNLFSTIEDSAQKCEGVTQALSNWIFLDESNESRLSVAMALFAAGLTSKTCLSTEVETAMHGGVEPSALAYLAMAFVQSERPELSNRYLDKVCDVEKESDACLMSQVVMAWSDENWSEVEKIFSTLEGPHQAHLLVWGVRHYIKQGRFDKALKYLTQMAPQPALGQFVMSQKTKALWEQGLRREAEQSFMAAMSSFDSVDRIDLASWHCLSALEESCAAQESLSCKVSAAALKQAQDLIQDKIFALAEIHRAHCQSKVTGELLQLKEVFNEGTMGQLLTAVDYNLAGEVDKAMKILAELNARDDLEEEIYRTTEIYQLRWTKSREDLKSLATKWLNDDQEHKPYYSRALFLSLIDNQLYELGLQVAEKLTKAQLAEEFFAQGRIVAHFSMGHKKAAWALYQTYMQSADKFDLLKSDREPASDDSFQSIVRQLNREFSRP